MGKITVNDVGSRAYRGLELLVVVPILGLGLIGVGTLLLSVLGLGGGTFGFGAFAGVGYLIIVLTLLLAHLVSPILLYLDAKRINEFDLGWEPSPGLNAVLALFFSYLVILNYLYHRHKHVVDWVDHDWWVYLVALGTVGPILFGYMFFTTDVQAVSTPFGPFYRNSAALLMPVALLILSAAAFQIAIYRDATYARLNGEWHPNPATYLTLASFFVFLSPIVYPITGGYYLFRRVRSVGV